MSDTVEPETFSVPFAVWVQNSPEYNQKCAATIQALLRFYRRTTPEQHGRICMEERAFKNGKDISADYERVPDEFRYAFRLRNEPYESPWKEAADRVLAGIHPKWNADGTPRTEAA